MEINDAERWVEDWLAENTGLSPSEIADKRNVNLFAEGLMDSMKFISFVTAAEDHFGIRFTQNDFDFTQARFSSIAGICGLIQGHLT